MMFSFDIEFSRHRWALIYCSISAIGALVFGYDNTYYSGILGMQQFKNDFGNHYEDGAKALATDFTSLTTSSIYIGDMVGALIAGPLNDRFGRKIVLWIASAFVLAGGVTQVADTNIEGVIVLGRILIGLGVGNFTVTSLLYIGEVAPLEIRSPALYMYQFLQSCSQLVASGLTQGTNSIESSLSYKLPMGGLVILPLILLIFLPFIPESPTWYVFRGRPDDAKRSLQKIHRNDRTYDPTTDLAFLEQARRYEETQGETSSWLSLLLDPVERKKLLWASGGMYAQQICGIIFFYNYGVVFAEALGVSQPFTITLITMILQIFAVAVSILTGNRLSRRINLLVSTGLIFLAFIIIGALGTQSTLSTASKYIIVVFSYVVICAYNFGLGPLTYAVTRELSVGVNQNKIMSVSIVALYFFLWLISFTAPYLYDDAGLGPMVGFVYAGTTLTSLAWVWFCVGETQGRTRLEVAMFFTEGVPARQWKTHVFRNPVVDEKGKMAGERAGAVHVEDGVEA
ncbi:general substrate transporter [Aspergillus ibericus CBS 121593]|uniref:General substrate transporter n=1 Tax=Aspergillus ibericus CBS 121593 TaxID=1448316 RepID=A0A395H708_9EURO|nr:general substrate transporter [Aspergillus ibericus CBS 121593]RAL03283.1 general substrate transporter [Aspergillus ibericus CBS 121593]